ncbi:YcgN family cysteine cluster protein [Methylophaga sp. OBS3]|uniref:YcgN family cysteine cluster protein n=1 Tax=Methylophaga sp. OBS3 TaxID=2991934 RepID=UPI0022507099|nr:YcgN family cysteine cluster protein [Methylophaga sp. OBS3]MCX4189210.1 YcgN family cysteine cluster protein [Methylophaga sp. OBS3]
MTDQHKTSADFWKHKRLSEMSHEEWESLCDGCGRCCLHKLEDEQDGRMYYTRVACDLLDIKQCRCSDYANRQTRMPDCIQLSVEQAHYFDWLPDTCAYRLLSEGEPLPNWHPLVTGDPQSVITAGVSVRDIAISADKVTDITEEVIALNKPRFPHDT